MLESLSTSGSLGARVDISGDWEYYWSDSIIFHAAFSSTEHFFGSSSCVFSCSYCTFEVAQCLSEWCNQVLPTHVPSEGK
jgi:hypothetical protein